MDTVFINSEILTDGSRVANNPYSWACEYKQFRYSYNGKQKNTVQQFDLGMYAYGRSQKIVNRNLIPMAIADKTNLIKGRLEDYYSLNLDFVNNWRDDSTTQTFMYGIEDREKLLEEISKDINSQKLTNIIANGIYEKVLSNQVD